MYRALIVEDEALMRDYLSARLGDLCPGWVAGATAADGMEAIERLAHERFDAVLTDIRMPGMDGLELARYIRRTDADTPILILSGYDEFDYARAAVRLNVFDYLLKPLNEAELSAALAAMAAVVAARKSKDTGALAMALEGGPNAAPALAGLLNGQSAGFLLLAPALTPDAAHMRETLDALQEAAMASFAPFCARLPKCVAVLCPAADPLLVETECRHTAQRFTEAHPTFRLHGGYAALATEDFPACVVRAEAALRLAQATDVPLLSERLLFSQRQAQTRLEAMLQQLNDALEVGQIAEERRASLLSAFGDFPAGVQLNVAYFLLMMCEAGDAARAHALRAAPSGPDPTQPDKVMLWFSAVLDALFAEPLAGNKPASALVQQARDYLQLHFPQPVSLSMLADQLSVTSAYLSSLFHREMGLSYSQYLLQLRMEDAARRLLGDPSAKIQDIGQLVGFPSAKHFTHVFSQYYRQSPRDYRENRGKLT
ncbi:MAG TPA: response regulator [Candidatus Limiplasma sp.]|nr:response regulator [Candidatus Limiplasma sp.]HPS81808.1 response regulator [Candidatus Limiplasma sp.]